MVLGGHDQACGAVGSGVITPGMVMDACGTVDAMVSVLPGFIIDRAMLDNKLPCYRHVDGTNYITMAINTNGGLFLKWYKNTFCHEESQLCGEQNCDIYTYIIPIILPKEEVVLIADKKEYILSIGKPVMINHQIPHSLVVKNDSPIVLVMASKVL